MFVQGQVSQNSRNLDDIMDMVQRIDVSVQHITTIVENVTGGGEDGGDQDLSSLTSEIPRIIRREDVAEPTERGDYKIYFYYNTYPAGKAFKVTYNAEGRSWESAGRFPDEPNSEWRFGDQYSYFNIVIASEKQNALCLVYRQTRLGSGQPLNISNIQLQIEPFPSEHSVLATLSELESRVQNGGTSTGTTSVERIPDGKMTVYGKNYVNRRFETMNDSISSIRELKPYSLWNYDETTQELIIYYHCFPANIATTIDIDFTYQDSSTKHLHDVVYIGNDIEHIKSDMLQFEFFAEYDYESGDDKIKASLNNITGYEDYANVTIIDVSCSPCLYDLAERMRQLEEKVEALEQA